MMLDSYCFLFTSVSCHMFLLIQNQRCMLFYSKFYFTKDPHGFDKYSVSFFLNAWYSPMIYIILYGFFKIMKNRIVALKIKYGNNELWNNRFCFDLSSRRIIFCYFLPFLLFPFLLSWFAFIFLINITCVIP